MPPLTWARLMENKKTLGPVPISLLSPSGKVLEPTDLGQLLLKLELGIGNELSQGPVRRLCGTLLGVHNAVKFLWTKDFAKQKVQLMSLARRQASSSIQC